jgi:hypothetical protein
MRHFQAATCSFFQAGLSLLDQPPRTHLILQDIDYEDLHTHTQVTLYCSVSVSDSLWPAISCFAATFSRFKPSNHQMRNAAAIALPAHSGLLRVKASSILLGVFTVPCVFNTHVIS